MNGMNLFEGLNWLVDDVARRLYYSSTVKPAEVEAKTVFKTPEEVEVVS